MGAATPVRRVLCLSLLMAGKQGPVITVLVSPSGALTDDRSLDWAIEYLLTPESTLQLLVVHPPWSPATERARIQKLRDYLRQHHVGLRRSCFPALALHFEYLQGLITKLGAAMLWSHHLLLLLVVL